MSRFRIILSAGVCSVALSGCIPAAAGLALSAASLVTGGGGGKGGETFRNPIDRQSTGPQVRQALSRLNDQVDPACQTMLDEHLKTHGTLTAGVTAKTKRQVAEESPAEANTPEANAAEAVAKQQNPPVNLLSKLSPGLDETGGAATVSVSADAVSGAPVATPVKAGSGAEPSADGAVATTSNETRPSDMQPIDLQPVKASLGPNAAPAPGQCEHRWVCLPGTPQPTMMLMCPGKGGDTPGTGTTVAGDAPATVASGDDKTPPQDERETAALGVTVGEAAPGAPQAAGLATAGRPAGVGLPAEAPPQDASPVPEQPEPARQTIRSGGVADWNWSYDPSKQL